MALVPSYKQALPSPATAFCDPDTGRINDAWLQFLLNLSGRTGGSPGPSMDLGTVAGATATNTASAADAAALAWLGDPPPDLGPATTSASAAAAAATANAAAVADLQTLAALHDAGDFPPSPDAAALLALVLAD